MVMIPSGFVQVTLRHDGPVTGGETATVLGMTDGTVTDLETISSDVNTAWVANMVPLLHDSFRYLGSRVITETQEGEANQTFAQGNRTGSLAPPNVSTLVRKNSPLRGRKFSGRSYLPGFLLDDDIFDDGTVSITPINAIQGALEQFWTDLAAANGYAQVILHNDATIPTVVETIATEAKVATQRRRLR